MSSPPDHAFSSPEVVAELQRRVLLRLELEDPLDTILPNVAREVYRLAGDPDSPLSAVSQVIEREPAMAARVVSMANSAYYRRAIAVETVTAGVLRLGLQGVRNAVILPRIKAKLSNDAFSQALWRHSRSVAGACQFVARRAKLSADTAFLAGLLHDMGRGVLWLEAKEMLDAYPRPQLDEAMDELHESVGELLLSRWALPEVVVLSAGWHHHPPAVASSPAERTAHVVAIADELVKAEEQASEPGPQLEASGCALDLDPQQIEEVRELMPEIIAQSVE